MTKITKGYLFGIMAAFFWGFHAVGVRYLIADIPSLTIATFRMLGGGFFILLFLFVKGDKIRFKVTDWKWFLIVAFVGTTLNTICFHMGLEYTTASAAILIESATPIFVVLILAMFFKERLKGINVVAVFVTFAGVLLIGSGKLQDSVGAGTLLGNFIELLSAITWAMFFIGSSRVFAHAATSRERLTNMAMIFLFAGIMLSPTLFVYDYSITWKSALLLTGLALFPSAMAFSFWYEAAARLPTVVASLMFNLAIIFTMINSVIFLGESITVVMLAGAILIIVGVSLTKIKANA